MPLKALFWAFAGNCHGGAAPMLAVAALPLFAFVGAAMDFSRAASAVRPLSEAWTALNARIDEMRPAGNANITIAGLPAAVAELVVRSARLRPISTWRSC